LRQCGRTGDGMGPFADQMEKCPMTSAIKPAATSNDDVLIDSELDAVVGGDVSLTEAMAAYMHAIFNPPPSPPPASSWSLWPIW
jgi:hypothetical protein